MSSRPRVPPTIPPAAPHAVPELIAARRSVRSFDPSPLDTDVLDRLVGAATLAPAPHHSRPWRWVVVTSPAGKAALARGMGERWRTDLGRDRVPPARIEELLAASRQRIVDAPTAILGCLTTEGLDRYPDETRQDAEWGMARLSLGAAVENLLLAATDAGLASCWVAAPIFCPDAARDALALDPEWVPEALVLVGHPGPTGPRRERPPVPLEELRIWR